MKVGIMPRPASNCTPRRITFRGFAFGLHSVLFPEQVFDKLADNELKVVIRLGFAFQFSVHGGAAPRGCLARCVQYKCSNKENQPC